MKRKIIAPALAIALLLSNGITAFAAPEVIPVDEVNYVFDYEYYAAANPDVAAATGLDREALLNHYIAFGRSENRAAYDMNTLIAAASAPVQANKKLLIRIEYYTLKDGEKSRSGYTYFYYKCDGQGNVLSKIRFYNNEGDSGISNSESYTYDGQGNILSEINTTHYKTPTYNTARTYDGQGNILSKTIRQHVPPTTITYTYDTTGNILSENRTGYYNDISSTTAYTYDAMGNVLSKSETFSTGYTDTDKWAYTYDTTGNILSETMTYSSRYPGLSTSKTYTYDAAGNILSESETSSNGSASTTAYTYDTMGNILSETVTSSNGSASITAYTYDTMGNILSETETSSNGSATSKTYTYDEQGNILMERTDRYDNGRLESSDISEYFYE